MTCIFLVTIKENLKKKKANMFKNRNYCMHKLDSVKGRSDLSC